MTATVRNVRVILTTILFLTPPVLVAYAAGTASQGLGLFWRMNIVTTAFFVTSCLLPCIFYGAGGRLYRWRLAQWRRATNESANADPRLRIPTHGVTLAGLERFVADIGGPAFTAGKTTSQICAQGLIPLTIEQKVTFAAMHSADPTLVREANVFVSHAWAMPFDLVLDAIRSHAAKDPNAVFWFDVLVNNQHFTADKPFSWWQTVFRSNVLRIGHTLLVLEWADPKPLKRIWCLWEIGCTVLESSVFDFYDKAVKLSVAMPSISQDEFVDSLITNFSSLAEKVRGVDLKSAEAFHGGECLKLPGGCPLGEQCPNDKQKIFGIISKAAGGFDEVNKGVKQALCVWMLKTVREVLGITDAFRANANDVLEKSDAATVASDLHLSYASLLRDIKISMMSSVDLVELNHTSPLFREDPEELLIATIMARRTINGNNHELVLSAIQLLAQWLLESIEKIVTAFSYDRDRSPALSRFDDCERYFKVAAESSDETIHSESLLGLAKLGRLRIENSLRAFSQPAGGSASTLDSRMISIAETSQAMLSALLEKEALAASRTSLFYADVLAELAELARVCGPTWSRECLLHSIDDRRNALLDVSKIRSSHLGAENIRTIEAFGRYALLLPVEEARAIRDNIAEALLPNNSLSIQLQFAAGEETFMLVWGSHLARMPLCCIVSFPFAFVLYCLATGTPFV